MKRFASFFLAFSIIASCALPVSADALDDIFKRAGSWENASVVKIPRFMMSLVNMAGISDAATDEFAGKVKSLRILNIENLDGAKADLLSRWLDQLDKEGKMSVAVKSCQDGETATIWLQSDGSTIHRIVVASAEQHEFSIVDIKGKFKEKDIDNIVNGK